MRSDIQSNNNTLYLPFKKYLKYKNYQNPISLKVSLELHGAMEELKDMNLNANFGNHILYIFTRSKTKAQMKV